jgi:hypothetical protein
MHVIRCESFNRSFHQFETRPGFFLNSHPIRQKFTVPCQPGLVDDIGSVFVPQNEGDLRGDDVR